MRTRRIAILALLAAAVWLGRAGAAAEDAPAPEAGETLLSAADAEKVIAEMRAFKATGCIKARIVTEVDDLLGVRKEEGELLLDRPTRVLRKFTRPAAKFWLLDGSQLQEYAPRKNVLYVKDFTLAPRKLKLIKAAFTGDMKTLQELFKVWVFRRPGGEKGPAAYRFVLTKGDDAASPLDYKRIQARLLENALFFHEFEFLPRDGDRTVERYSDIVAAAKPSEEEFAAAVALPAGVKRETLAVDRDGESKK
ncbi:MAG: hypothetical protein NTW87_17505 [Planctomycetota bacterium]|nr:hypothetical protein [Planctomycetota bacterium]